MTAFQRAMERLYRLFLFAYPRSFRVDATEEMLDTLRARATQVRSEEGPLRTARFWARELLSVLRTASRQRWSQY